MDWIIGDGIVHWTESQSEPTGSHSQCLKQMRSRGKTTFDRAKTRLGRAKVRWANGRAVAMIFCDKRLTLLV